MDDIKEDNPLKVLKNQDVKPFHFDAKERFPLKEEAIPPQRWPGWIRWPLRVLALPILYLDLWSTAIVHRIWPPPYRLEGACKMRGACCHYLLMELKAGNGELTYFSRLRIWWYTEINGFYFRSFSQVSEGKNLQILSCRYLGKDNKCKHYHLRPGICRRWPRIDHFAVPGILKGCGYRIIKRKKDED